MAPCSVVQIDRYFRVSYGRHHQGNIAMMIMETVSTYETSIYFCETIQRHILEECYQHASPADGANYELGNLCYCSTYTSLHNKFGSVSQISVNVLMESIFMTFIYQAFIHYLLFI
jgi:hypothetical protein